MRVGTVRGAMAVDGLGTMLMHEYVFVLTPDVMQNYGHEWWDEQDRVADAVRQLQALKDAGVDSIVDPPVAGLGRYIPRVQRVNEHQTGRLALDFYERHGVDLTKVVIGHAGDSNDLRLPQVDPGSGRDVLPALREHGVDEAQITAMLVHNPARYFTGGQE